MTFIELETKQVCKVRVVYCSLCFHFQNIESHLHIFIGLPLLPVLVCLAHLFYASFDHFSCYNNFQFLYLQFQFFLLT